MHWVNVIAVVALLGSGLQIFNAHPALYWGKSSYTGAGPLMQIDARRESGSRDAGGGGEARLVGVTRIGSREWRTTGVLGVSADAAGRPEARAFPAWATIPGSRWLAMGRRWHFFFAWLFVVNGLCYTLYSLGARHLSRDLVPQRGDWRRIGHTLRQHVLLGRETGEAARSYNLLQKLAYLLVMFALLPFLVLMGLAMSPWFDTVWPGWVDLFGGRQAARTLHFLAATGLVLFVVVHLFQVVVTGPINNLRSMITGNYRVLADRTEEAAHGGS